MLAPILALRVVDYMYMIARKLNLHLLSSLSICLKVLYLYSAINATI
jgi:hypothetical protein